MSSVVQMVDLQKQADAAAAARDYRRRDDLIKQAHDESVQRSKDLHAFGDCLKKAHVTKQQGRETPSTTNSGQPDQPGNAAVEGVGPLQRAGASTAGCT